MCLKLRQSLHARRSDEQLVRHKKNIFLNKMSCPINSHHEPCHLTQNECCWASRPIGWHDPRDPACLLPNAQMDVNIQESREYRGMQYFTCKK